MKKTQSLLFAIGCYLLSSCSTVTSSYHYTKGTEQLACENYPEAIVELEQAVKLDPEMARNHTNLAAAYFGNNNPEKSWYYCRQAVRARYQDGISYSQFLMFYNAKIVQPGLNKPGTSWKEIFTNLGEPDACQKDENGEPISCSYGICAMLFSDGLLTNCALKP